MPKFITVIETVEYEFECPVNLRLGKDAGANHVKLENWFCALPAKVRDAGMCAVLEREFEIEKEPKYVDPKEKPTQ